MFSPLSPVYSNSAKQIYHNHRNRDLHIQNCLKCVGKAIPHGEEEGFDINTTLIELNDLIAKEEKDRKKIKKKIHHYKTRRCGLGAAKSCSENIGKLLKISGWTAGILEATMTLFTIVFAEDDDKELLKLLLLIFGIPLLIFSFTFLIGTAILSATDTAFKKLQDYKIIKWEKDNDLQSLVKYLEEVKKLESTTTEIEINVKMRDLDKKICSLPKKHKGVRIFKSESDMRNYLLRHLPLEHPIRQKLLELERIYTEGSEIIGSSQDIHSHPTIHLPIHDEGSEEGEEIYHAFKHDKRLKTTLEKGTKKGKKRAEPEPLSPIESIHYRNADNKRLLLKIWDSFEKKVGHLEYLTIAGTRIEKRELLNPIQNVAYLDNAELKNVVKLPEEMTT